MVRLIFFLSCAVNCIFETLNDQIGQLICVWKHLPHSFLGSFAAYSSFCPRKIFLTMPHDANSEKSHEAKCLLITKKFPWKTTGGILRELEI